MFAVLINSINWWLKCHALKLFFCKINSIEALRLKRRKSIFFKKFDFYMKKKTLGFNKYDFQRIILMWPKSSIKKAKKILLFYLWKYNDITLDWIFSKQCKFRFSLFKSEFLNWSVRGNNVGNYFAMLEVKPS